MGYYNEVKYSLTRSTPLAQGPRIRGLLLRCKCAPYFNPTPMRSSTGPARVSTQSTRHPVIAGYGAKCASSFNPSP